MLLWPHLAGTQLSLVAPRSWALLSGHTSGNRHDWRAKPAIYDAKRIAAAKAKRAAHKSQALRINTVIAQALPTCPRCQRTFRARIRLVGHLRTQCNNNPTTLTSTTPASDPTTTTTPTTDNNFIDAPPPTTPDTILPVPITGRNTICPTHTT
ncbi:unnamed protein product [Schistocephalus solidus]|uniref:C2H2-type domain-containing protein n=1 Tax=Schistocephalus solidus TaxID=70667 RepID=A0A183S7M9_SCHSO|nr:unnamed protein product [Schistocephalus solidus]